MKRQSSKGALLVFMVALCSMFAFNQEIDLSGTWVGTTMVPDQGEDEMTLVIEKEEGEYSATTSDSFGMFMDTECEDFEFKDGTLTFNISIAQDLDTFTVWLTLEVEGDTMKGYWETAEGDQGDIELKKQ
jgi:hypothetical protein